MLKSLNTWSDIEIVSGIKNNQNEAFEKLYRLDREGVIHHVTNNSGSYEDATDILQEAVLVVWNKIKTGKYIQQNNAQLKTYFNRICRNLWYKELRKRRILTSMPDEFEAEDDLSLDFTQQEELLASCFARLRNKCQSVLRLRFWENKKLDEIAAELNNSVNVIKNDSSDCLKSLRECFKSQK